MTDIDEDLSREAQEYARHWIDHYLDRLRQIDSFDVLTWQQAAMWFGAGAAAATVIRLLLGY